MTALAALARHSLRALAVATAAAGSLAAALATPLAAQQPVQQPAQVQLAQVQLAQVQLAFGYHCDDTFALRNEGAQTVDIDFVVLGTADKGRVTVKPSETVQIESATAGDVELYVDGKLVATEHKGRRSCAELAGGATGTVTVRHLDPADVVYVQPRYEEPVYVHRRAIVYVRPWDYGYIVRPSFSLQIGFPLGYRSSRGHMMVRHDRFARRRR